MLFHALNPAHDNNDNNNNNNNGIPLCIHSNATNKC